jgi:hypothetical protein
MDRPGLNLREPLHAVGVNLGNPVLEGCVLDSRYRKGYLRDELPPFWRISANFERLLQGKDAMPLGAVFVIAFCPSSSFPGLRCQGQRTRGCSERLWLPRSVRGRR